MPRADPLERYNAKRNFAKTAEPSGKPGKGKGNRFIVQKHDATRLHWDFRLEVDGVLKSWAITRGPSANPDDKRLAVRTEDHPLSYADFEGTIPKGEYGGGTVMLWDNGTWAPIEGKSVADLDAGHLHFTLTGRRMKGEWMLIRLKPRGKERGENWLLRKVGDAFTGGSDDLVEHAVTSVTTGRTMDEIARGMRPATKSKSPTLKMPAFRPPQLATLVDSVPAGSSWMHEVKYDGYRAIVAIAGNNARIFTRSGLDWTEKFPEIAAAASALDIGSALIDGEICALDENGRPDFSTLRSAIKDGGSVGLTFFAFDLLEQNGVTLVARPNVERKEQLRAVLAGQSEIVFAEHIIGGGDALFETMCREGYEGIIAKRVDATYAGKRTQAWLKVKCTRRQEFVIIGWAQSAARSRGFKSLLLAVHDNSALRYAGKVGTGFDDALLTSIRTQLDELATDEPPVDVPRLAAKGAHWVKPKLVAEVAFAEFTADDVVRHASFIALRGDNPASAVVLEKPAEVPPDTDTVKITNADRVIFPGDGITKGQLADYYRAVGAIMLPVTARRPISLVRCPQGRAKACFFQKHDAGSFGDTVHKVPIREKDGTSEDYLWVDSVEGFVACVQMGTIEFHGWGARSDDVETPDRLIFDLDPDDSLTFDDVKKAAVDLKMHLADLGLVSFAMLTGGKGIHVLVPLCPEAKWPEVKDFADRFARALAVAEPDRFVATMSKVKRKGRVFIDWLRNQRGNTAVLPYVVRARPGAPVAAPVTWEELRKIQSAGAFNIGDAAELVARSTSSELAGWGIADQALPDL